MESAAEKLSLLDFCSPQEIEELSRLERHLELLGVDSEPNSPKRRRFVEEYCVDFNAARAYLRAGFRGRSTAAQNASNLLNDPAVRYQILRRRITLRARAEVSQERVVQELASIAFANIADYLTVDEDGHAQISVEGVDREQMSAVQEISFTETEKLDGEGSVVSVKRQSRIRLHDKLAALEKLMRYLGIDKKQVIIDLAATVTEGSARSETPARELIAGRLAGIAERARPARDPGQSDGGAAS